MIKWETGCWLLCVTEVLKDTTHVTVNTVQVNLSCAHLQFVKWTTQLSLSYERICGIRVIFYLIARCLFNDIFSGKNHSLVVSFMGS